MSLGVSSCLTGLSSRLSFSFPLPLDPVLVLLSWVLAWGVAVWCGSLPRSKLSPRCELVPDKPAYSTRVCHHTNNHHNLTPLQDPVQHQATEGSQEYDYLAHIECAEESSLLLVGSRNLHTAAVIVRTRLGRQQQ